MKLSAFKEFHFCAAHCLNISGHRCSQIHGHNYKLRIDVSGEAEPSTGMVIDFDEIKKAVKPLIDQVDHSNLNDTIGNTTSEMIALWFYKNLKNKISGLTKIEVRETDTCGAVLELK